MKFSGSNTPAPRPPRDGSPGESCEQTPGSGLVVGSRQVPLSLAAPPGFFAITDGVAGGAGGTGRCVVGLASGNSGAGGVGGSVRRVRATARTWWGAQSIPVLALGS